MIIDKISSTTFSTRLVTVNKIEQLQAGDKKYIGIKPIKNFAQYIKEYGLDLRQRKK